MSADKPTFNIKLKKDKLVLLRKIAAFHSLKEGRRVTMQELTEVELERMIDRMWEDIKDKMPTF